MAYFSNLNGRGECFLCPSNCFIKDGNSGVCGVRFNKDGKLELPFYGVVSALNTDPVEKKPLYHFYPGSEVFSVGFYGCNFHCSFCQNYKISQVLPDNSYLRKLSPEDLVSRALDSGAPSIAYTYSEPLIHYEYVLRTAETAHAAGMRNILVTNGYLNKEPSTVLLQQMDAVNIDLKSFTESFYRNLGGKLEPVKDFIRTAAEITHIEVTTLLIPGLNDTENEIAEIASFISSINNEIPLHLSCYFPSYKSRIPATPIETVKSRIRTAGEFLKYVYPGNTGYEEINTFCGECGSIIISRRGYKTDTSGLLNQTCRACGAGISFPV